MPMPRIVGSVADHFIGKPPEVAATELRGWLAAAFELAG